MNETAYLLPYPMFTSCPSCGVLCLKDIGHGLRTPALGYTHVCAMPVTPEKKHIPMEESLHA